MLSNLQWHYFTPKGPIPSRTVPCLVSYQHYIYMFSGTAANLVFVSAVHRFNTKTFEWELVCHNAPSITGYIAVVWNHSVILHGGFDCKGWQTDNHKTYQFDLLKHDWKALHTHNYEKLPSIDASGVVYKNCLYIFGGIDLKNNMTNALRMLDLKNLRWSIIQGIDPPKKRGLHHAVLYRQNMIIYGGYGSDLSALTNGTFHRFDFVTKKWTKVLIDTKLSVQYMCVVDDQILILGSVKPETLGFLYQVDLHAHKIKKLQFTQVENSLNVVAGYSDEKLFVFGLTNKYSCGFIILGVFKELDQLFHILKMQAFADVLFKNLPEKRKREQ